MSSNRLHVGGRTTGRPDLEEGEQFSPPPPRSMNMYDAVKQTEMAKKQNRSSSKVDRPAKKATDGPFVLGKPKGNKADDVEFGVGDVFHANTGQRGTTARKSRTAYVPQEPTMARASSTQKPALYSSNYASANNSYSDAELKRPAARPQFTPSQKSKAGKTDCDDESTFDGIISYQEVRPGAERVGGPNASDYDDDSMLTAFNTVNSSPQQPRVGTTQPHTELIDATVVASDEQERRLAERRAQQKKDAPLAGIRKDRPWYKRPGFIIPIVLLIVTIIVAVAVTVPLTHSNTSNAGNVPTYRPTSSPAPTAMALITAVVQLDASPGETGWKLICDGETIHDSPPGTYGLVADRPNFRVEYELEVTVGAECELTLMDSGSNGLNPGLYEVYSGSIVGETGSLITGGTIAGSKSTVSFVVGDASFGSGASPTSAPTELTIVSTASCTVCPDGRPVLFPEAETIGGLTCEQLEELARSVTNDTECIVLQDDAATQCGCRENCKTMCPDGVSGPNPANYQDIVFIKDDRQVTCAEFQNQISSSRSNSVDKCLSANFLGEDVCGCPPSEAFCRICEGTDGGPSTNPPAEAMDVDIVPGVSCRDITGIAYTLKRDDPSGRFQRLCPACLAIGAYCGCDQPPDGRQFCRLCGGSKKLLPEPGRLVESKVLGQTTSCFHVELMANVNDPNTLPCEVFQTDSSLDCCFD